VAISDADRRAALETLRQAQFVYGLSRYPKKQVLDDPADVKALRQRLEAMRDAARRLSSSQRDALDVPWGDLDAVDSGTEAVWNAAKKVTPKIIAKLAPLVSDSPEAAFLINPVKGGAKSQEDLAEPKVKRAPEPAKIERGLTGKELAGLEMAIQERATADEAFFSWLRRDRELSVSEWRKRRASAERARRAEDAYIEKLFKAHSSR